MPSPEPGRSGPPSLSNSAHTSTLDGPSGTSVVRRSTVTIWGGGELVEARRCPPGESGAPAVGGGKRGQVSTVQSFASRRRMGQFLGKLDSASVPVFVTLTIPRTCCPSPEGLADALAALRMRFMRAFPAATLVWKREHHASGVPHFHALVWLNSGESLAREVYQLQRWLRPAWSEILAVQARVKVDAARDSKAVKHYASGYLWRGKGYQLDAQGIHWGRWWGVWNPDGLPYGERQIITGPDSMYHQVSRAAARAGYRGKQPRTNQPTVRFLAKGDPAEWARLAGLAGGVHVADRAAMADGSPDLQGRSAGMG